MITHIENTLNIQEMMTTLIGDLSNPESVNFSYEQNDIMPWNPLGLSHGYPGLIVLFSELDRYFPEKDYSFITHKYMIKVKEIIERNSNIEHVSLFNGSTGVNFSIRLATQGGVRYSSMHKSLEDYSLPFVQEYVKQVVDKHNNLELGAYEFCYDLITGITGIGRYALSSNHPEYRRVLEEILTHMVTLTNYQDVHGTQVTGFHSSPETIIVEEDKRKYPKGYVNLGLSHGIAGPLALLSLAKIKGVVVDGQEEAIRTLVSELSSHVSFDDRGPYYKRMIGIDELIKGGQGNEMNERFDAWCYGSFGICRAFSLAYEATGDPEIKGTTRILLNTLVSVPLNNYNVISPILCHGYSGNLQVLNRLVNAAAIKDDIELVELCNERRALLLKGIIEDYDLKYKYGFADVIRDKDRITKEVEKVGLLEGAVGILLAIVSSTNPKIEPKWDEFLLLS